jgi:hypothetical protein
MKDQNLITEINSIRSMMGLKNKPLILENAIIGLAKAFTNFAARHADDVTKIFDDFLEVSVGGSGSLAAANRLKGLFDDLDNAVRTGDDLLIKRTVSNMLSSTDFGTSVSAKLIDDIFMDTSDDALKSVLTKRANSLKGQGVPDEVIARTLKEDIDNIFSDFPSPFINAVKTKLDNTISWGGKGSKLAKEVTADDVYAVLGQSEVWRKFTSKFPDALAEMRSTINTIIEGGARTADEVADVVIKQASSKLNPNIWKKIKSIAAKNPKTSKAILVLIGMGALRAFAGATGLWNQIKLYLCDFWFGSADDDCQEMKAAMEELEKEIDNNENNEENNTGVCDATLEKFKTYLDNLGVDPSDATWDTNTCTGTVSGSSFSYKDGQFI